MGKENLPGMIRALLIITLFVAVNTYIVEAGNVKKEILKREKRLMDIKKKIAGRDKVVRDISGKERTILGELQRIDKAVVRYGGELKDIRRGIRLVTGKIKDASVSMTVLKKRQIKLSELIRKRLLTMYKMRNGGEIKVILSSSSPWDMERRYRYLTVLIESNARLMEDYKKNIASLDNSITKLKKLKREKLTLKKRMVERFERLKVERAGRVALLKDVKKRKRYHMQSIKELKEAANELMEVISRLKAVREQRYNGVGFASMKGELPMPVKGDVMKAYGRIKDSKFHTVTFNNGIFVKAPLGAKVRSVYKGKVAYAGWLKGYGQILIIDHGRGFFTLFAHLSEILKGLDREVASGEVVALVGNTGSLSGSGLYFEIRKNGMPDNPMKWFANR